MSGIEDVLNANEIMTLATVCEDGSPWATPVKFGVLKNVLYWRSYDESTHSKNIQRDGRVSISVCDAIVRPVAGELQAAYIQTIAEKIDETQWNEILSQIGHRMSSRDEGLPIYAAPLGEVDEANATDSRFYRKYAPGVIA
jgi:hypothetical protein